MERLGSRRDKRWIVLPPYNQSRRFVLAQPRLPRRIGSDVGSIVVEQRGLNLTLARLRQVNILIRPGVRIVTLGMRGAERMALFGCCQRHERVEHFRMPRWIGPILRDAGPLGAQAFLIDVGVLNDESLHACGMRQHDAEADRPAVVMKKEDAFLDLELLQETMGRLGQVIEGVGVGRRRRRVALAEARKVRCEHMISCCKQRNERIEFARGGREPVQQHDRRCVLRTGLPIEDADSVNCHMVIARRSRRRFHRAFLCEASRIELIHLTAAGRKSLKSKPTDLCNGSKVNERTAPGGIFSPPPPEPGGFRKPASLNRKKNLRKNPPSKKDPSKTLLSKSS